MLDFLYEQFKLALATNQLLSGGLILGLLSIIGYKLRDALVFIWNKIKVLTIFSVYIDDDYTGMFNQFSNWYKEHYPDKFRSTQVTNKIEFDLVTRKFYSKINLKQFADSNLIWYKNRFLYIHKERETFSSATSRDNFYVNKYIIKGFLARRVILDLLTEIGSFEIKLREEKTRLGIFLYNDYWSEIAQDKCIIKDFDKIYLSNKKEIIDVLDNFKNSFDKYLDLGLSHKTSMLFYGIPGGGKSSICTAIAQYLNYPIYNLNLSSVEKDSQLQRAISDIPSNSILLLEDIDRFLPDNNNKAKFNLGTLLNCLDGNSSLSNCIVLMTTNHLDKIDNALIRSGRVDHKFEIGYPTKENVEQFLSKFYKEEVRLKNPDLNKTMSDIQTLALSGSLEATLSKIELKEKVKIKAA